jgi:hypothetical protein
LQGVVFRCFSGDTYARLPLPDTEFLRLFIVPGHAVNS